MINICREGVVKIKKELIRKAAIDVIAENGFFNAAVDRIAARAGVAVGTVYNYFEKKEDILDYIFQVEYEKRVSFLEDLKKRDTGPVEKIREIMNMHFSEMKKNPNLARVLLRERGFAEQDKMIHIKKFEELPAQIKDIIQEGVDKGFIRKCNPEILSVIIFGAVEALMTKFILENKNGEISDIFDVALEEMSNLLEKGLVQSPGES
ncbi:TetR/AcrR family transcriptional regulator [Biomaibacter acetigenes]|uniref:TetR/AcrR family transcriptional regulator n=1 Tax=Biomaibacter acetigenes TaxID=2316383 RepID=A0A3G2R8W5_9FIRM|nr:TetR/AcrR family transcriptional regulator [Biomaibacter acetigenes]